MTERRHRVRVTDRRLSASEDAAAPQDEETSPVEEVPESEIEVEQPEEQHDYLEDLRRLQAEFENYRKRIMKDQAATAARAAAGLVERLLPVLDNFERAISHGEASPGIELIYKDFRRVLEAEGLEQIPAADRPFDPQVHEAVASHHADVEEPHVAEVYREGYRFRGTLLRPAMVVVARPHDEKGSKAETARE